MRTMQEIDDAIRYSAGLRWAIMGPILTRRIGNAETDVRRFMERTGPSLKWPYTKFTDVPELTDAFLDRLAEQPDPQVENLTSHELEQQRDDCLVAVLQGLRSQGYRAGETLARWEQGLQDRVAQITDDSR